MTTGQLNLKYLSGSTTLCLSTSEMSGLPIGSMLMPASGKKKDGTTTVLTDKTLILLIRITFVVGGDHLNLRQVQHGTTAVFTQKTTIIRPEALSATTSM